MIYVFFNILTKLIDDSTKNMQFFRNNFNNNVSVK